MPPRRSKNRKPRWDFEIPSESSEISDGLMNIVAQFCQGERIVVFEGAGTSVSSGIPDFRSMNGIYARYKQEGKGKQGEQLFHVDMLDNNNTRKHFFQICDDIYNLAKGARPALYHQLIDCLRPRVRRRYCYNIDGIGTKDRKFLALNTTVPSTEPWPTTIAMHGLLTYVYCDKCGQVFEYSVEKYGPFVDEPTCPDCEEGTLLPRIELYGDTVGTWTFDTEEHKRIIQSDLQQPTDVLFAVGTTAAVLSMQQNLKLFASPARLRIWLNPKDPPPDGLKKLFVKIRGKADNFAGLCMRYLKDAGRLEMISPSSNRQTVPGSLPTVSSRNYAERTNNAGATKKRKNVEPVIRFHLLRRRQRRKERLKSRSNRGSALPTEQSDETVHYPSKSSLLSGEIGQGEIEEFRKGGPLTYNIINVLLALLREVAIQQGCIKFYITNVYFWKALEREDFTDAGRWIQEALKLDGIAVPVHTDDSWSLVGIENLQYYSEGQGADFFFGSTITHICDRLLNFLFGKDRRKGKVTFHPFAPPTIGLVDSSLWLFELFRSLYEVDPSTTAGSLTTRQGILDNLNAIWDKRHTGTLSQLPADIRASRLPVDGAEEQSMAYASRSGATHDDGPSIDGLHTGPPKKELSAESWLDERISLSLEVMSECRHLGSKLNEFFDFYEKESQLAERC